MPVVQPGEQAVAGLPIRRLSRADLAACVELTVDRDWPPEPDKWRLLFAVGEVYGVDDPAGGLAGTVVLTRYGRGLAAVGMMVVASRHSRRGLGRRLLSFALEQADGAVILVELARNDFFNDGGWLVLDLAARYFALAAGSVGGWWAVTA